jgi:hypothetical protein
VNLIRPRLRQHRHDTGTSSPILCAEVARLYRKLIDSIRIGQNVARVAYASHVDAAIEIVGHLPNHVVRRAVDDHMLTRKTNRVLRGIALDTRRQAQELIDIPSNQRQVVDLAIINRAPQNRITQIHQRHIGGHLDDRAFAARLKRKIDRGLLRRRKDDASPKSLTDTGEGHFDAIRSNRQKLRTILALAIALRHTHEVRLRLRQGDRCASNSRST